MLQLKKTIAFCVITASIYLFCNQVTKAIEVTFPDVNLENAVRSELGIPSGIITNTNMETLASINASRRSISNIEGLEYAKNLTNLNLCSNDITNISAIAGLTNLAILDLTGNDITHFSSLANLTNLGQLYLSGNNISGMNTTDITAIAGLTNLTHLNLGLNNISDISALNGLTNLNYLSMVSNNITDISAIANLTSLTNVQLHSNNITDISAVAGLTNMMHLGINSNEIVDISAISELKKLNTLSLEGNKIIDISVVAGLGNMISLQLNANNIVDVSPIANLANLKYLALYDNQIETLNLTEANCNSLLTFNIGKNPLKKVILSHTAFAPGVFDTLMDGGDPLYTGIAGLEGVLSFDMSDADFFWILDLSSMYGMDDLEEVCLARATNLNGREVVALTTELDSLNLLDVTGLWDSFSTTEQNSLYTWGMIEGNTLITNVPEPSTLTLLLALASLGVLLKRRRP